MRRPHLALVLALCGGACTPTASGTDPGAPRSSSPPAARETDTGPSGPPTRESLIERFEADLARPGRDLGAECKVLAAEIRAHNADYHPYEGRVTFACGADDEAQARYVLGPRSGRWLPWEPVR